MANADDVKKWPQGNAQPPLALANAQRAGKADALPRLQSPRRVVSRRPRRHRHPLAAFQATLREVAYDPSGTRKVVIGTFRSSFRVMLSNVGMWGVPSNSNQQARAPLAARMGPE